MDQFFVDLSVVMVVSATLAAIAVMLRQPIILAYIACGILVGPWGTGWVHNVQFIEIISHLGITLLLFLTGLCLHPQKLIKLFGKASFVTLANSAISFLVGFVIVFVFKFSLIDSICIGLAVMFSSTILVVKLLPTTDLHQQRMGAFCIGALILQDLLAVAVLAFIRCLGPEGGGIVPFIILSGKVVLFIITLVGFEYFILRRIITKVELLHEALFIIGLAWCFGVASISHNMGLFYETGAFFSGVVLARHKIAQFISMELKPLRDFFLVLFFFTLGVGLDFKVLQELILISVPLTAFFVFVRPLIFKKLLIFSGEKESFSKEAGVRMGQLSEFALLIGMLALELDHITNKAAQLIHFVTILSFVASSYYVFKNYATPIGISGKLMKD